MQKRPIVSAESAGDRDGNLSVRTSGTIGTVNAVRPTAHGEGIYVYAPDGRRYIDAPGGAWNVQVGYGNPEIAKAMADQAQALPFHAPGYHTSDPASTLAERLAKSSPGDLNRVFFAPDGSSAVDSALRFMHFYNNLLGRPRKKITIACEKAYHGSTYLASTVSADERDRTFVDTATDLVRFLPDVNPSQSPLWHVRRGLVRRQSTRLGRPDR